ncbi:MAG TPA: DsbA family protein [Nannocystaceae bacterium]|nr:DsbA family protein [Nannocystaceae bacterium]
MARRFPALVLVALFACDAAKQSDVDGLQQRLDTVANEQAALRKRADEADAGKTAEAEARKKLELDLGAAKDEIELLKGRITALESVPKPTTPPVKPVAGRPDPAERYVVAIGDSQARGPADARVTVVVFSDFQCPFCERVQTTLKDLQAAYPKDVRVVAKHLPLAMHPNAMGAALAAEAAGKQGKFWELHDKLYENRSVLGEADVERYAKELGLDMARFKKDRDSAAVKALVDADVKQAADVGARGTPSFFINGRFLSGAQPLESFKTLVDTEIAKADELIARGVSRAGVYDELMSTAKAGVGKPGL